MWHVLYQIGSVWFELPRLELQVERAEGAFYVLMTLEQAIALVRSEVIEKGYEDRDLAERVAAAIRCGGYDARVLEGPLPNYPILNGPLVGDAKLEWLFHLL